MCGRNIRDCKGNTVMLFFVMTFLFMHTSCLCQSDIHGRVEEGQRLHGVTVLLFDRDSVMVRGTLTDSTGAYTFRGVGNGTYQVAARMIGYEQYKTSTVKITLCRTSS
jgi:hypothetical protein